MRKNKHNNSSNSTNNNIFRSESIIRILIISILIVLVDSSSSSLSYEKENRNNGVQQNNNNDQKPNILFLLLDQWRYDWDSLHTTPTGKIPLNLPFIQRAALMGTRFTQAYVPSPICAPSRGCMASGKEYDYAGVLINHADDYPPDQITFYKLLRDDGNYHTMTCGKDDLYKADINFPYYPGTQYEFLTDLGFSDALRSAGKTHVIREHEPYEMYRILLEETMVDLQNGTQITAYEAYRACHELDTTKYNNDDKSISDDKRSLCDITSFPDELYPDNYVRDNAIKLLRRKPKTDNKPWFLQVNFPGPHPPNLVTSSMASSVINRNWPPPFDSDPNIDTCPQQYFSGNKQPPKHKIQPQNGGSGRCNYGAEIENIDMLMKSIVIDTIDKELNELHNTVVCISGDHGEMLGDHYQFAKSKPWTGSVSVPLICFGPNITQGQTYDSPVATLDLVGTFLDYANVQPDLEMTTQSLRPILEYNNVEDEEVMSLDIVKEEVRSYVSSGYHNWRMVVKEIITEEGESEETTISYKLICCKGPCDGAPSTAMAELIKDDEWHMLLYDTMNDRFDMEPINDKLPFVLEELQQLLPPGWCPIDGSGVPGPENSDNV